MSSIGSPRGRHASARTGLRRFGWEPWALGSIIVLSGALAWLFPRSADDWGWASNVGHHRLHTFFAGYNGRYAGDLFIIALMHAQAVIPIVEAATIALLVWLLLDLAEHRTPVGYAITALLLLTMPLDMWRQTVAWASGFANYAPPAVALLVFLRTAKLEWLGRLSARRRWLRRAVVLGFAAASALFLESFTVYLVVASALLVLVQSRRRRSFSLDSAAWLVGAAVGAAVMFSNSAYRHGNGAPAQHQISVFSGSLRAKLVKLFDRLSYFGVGETVVLDVVLVLLVCLVATTEAVRARRWPGRVAMASAAGFLALTTTLRIAEQRTHVDTWLRCLVGVAVVLLVVALLTTAITAIGDSGRRDSTIAALASCVLLTVPLVAATPIAARLLLPTYLLLICIVNILLRELADAGYATVISRAAPFVAATAVACLAAMIAVYADIQAGYRDRIAYIRSQLAAGHELILIKPLPFPSFVHLADPQDTVWNVRFKEYYDLPAELQIVVYPPSRSPK